MTFGTISNSTTIATNTTATTRETFDNNCPIFVSFYFDILEFMEFTKKTYYGYPSQCFI